MARIRHWKLWSDLVQAITAATSWAEITEVLDDAQLAFEGKRLDGDEVENLAEHARRRARGLPPGPIPPLPGASE